jgi:hypothetical protein
MFFENRVEIEKEMEGSQRIMSIDLPADKIDDKESEKFQSSLEIGRGNSEQLFAENSFGEFQYLGRKTFNKAKNLVLSLKQRAPYDYRYLA